MSLFRAKPLMAMPRNSLSYSEGVHDRDLRAILESAEDGLNPADLEPLGSAIASLFRKKPQRIELPNYGWRHA